MPRGSYLFLSDVMSPSKLTDSVNEPLITCVDSVKKVDECNMYYFDSLLPVPRVRRVFGGPPSQKKTLSILQTRHYLLVQATATWRSTTWVAERFIVMGAIVSRDMDQSVSAYQGNEYMLSLSFKRLNLLKI